MKRIIAAILFSVVIVSNNICVSVEAETVRETTELLSLINQYRVLQHLNPLTESYELDNAALVRASEQAKVFSHTRPDGTQWFTVSSSTYGEILGRGMSGDIEVMDSWKASSSHNDLLVDPGFKTIGIARVGDCYVCEFGY